MGLPHCQAPGPPPESPLSLLHPTLAPAGGLGWGVQVSRWGPRSVMGSATFPDTHRGTVPPPWVQSSRKPPELTEMWAPSLPGRPLGARWAGTRLCHLRTSQLPCGARPPRPEASGTSPLLGGRWGAGSQSQQPPARPAPARVQLCLVPGGLRCVPPRWHLLLLLLPLPGRHRGIARGLFSFSQNPHPGGATSRCLSPHLAVAQLRVHTGCLGGGRAEAQAPSAQLCPPPALCTLTSSPSCLLERGGPVQYPHGRRLPQ